MADIPENITLDWLGRTLLSFREEMRDMRRDLDSLKRDVRAIREDLDVVALRVIRIESSLTSLRDEIGDLYGRQGELRRRVDAIETKTEG
jgi:chromosome segregation ATPase